MDWYTAVAAVMCICVNEGILAAFHVWMRAVVNLIFTAQLIFRVVGLLTTEPFTWIALVVFVVKGFSTASEKKEEKLLSYCCGQVKVQWATQLIVELSVRGQQRNHFNTISSQRERTYFFS